MPKDLFGWPLWQNILADIVFFGICWLVPRIKRFATRWYPATRRLWNRAYLIALFVLLVASNTIYLNVHWPYPALFLSVSTAAIFFLLWKELSQFWNIGVIGGDVTVRSGIDYTESLSLCRNRLDFLGVGASKLTGSNEFVPAVRRCNRPDIPIRFLLLDPDDHKLQEAAERKGVGSGEYRRTVIASLRTLAELRLTRQINIEVRFYNSIVEPVFRLMFINDQLCLASYNVFGEGDGSGQPQIYFKRFADKRDTDSFYHPFRLYFSWLWENSTEWDYQVKD